MKRMLLPVVPLFLLACGGGDAPPPEEAGAATESASAEDATWALLDAMAVRYADASAAMADGFIRDPAGHCVTAEMVGLPATQGAMGVHYLHPARLGLDPESMPVNGSDGVVDWGAPEVLVYEPQPDGSERLVAVEYLVFQAPWAASGQASPPSFFGEPFVSMADDPATEADEAHGFMPHYELHIWVPRDNPTGRFAEFNPAVTCEHAPMPPMQGMD